MNDFRAEAEALRDELVARRRDLHQHPELSFEEVRTAGIIADELGRLGLEVQTGIGKTGVIGILEGDHDGPTVMYRADMDALPIQEENEVEYVSRIPGKMHACGHDGHVTIALGVAKLLSQRRATLAGRVKFVFQPAEEIGAGSLAMIKDGVLHEPKADVVLGLHLWTPLPLGTIGVAEGPVMSGCSVFRVVIQGKGGHAALPYTTHDPVVCTAQIINALHALVSRRVNLMDGVAVLSVTSLATSSHATNVIPDQVEILGTFRTFDAVTSRQIEQHIQQIAASTCQTWGCTAEVSVTHQTIPVINDSEVTARVRDVFAGSFDELVLDGTARTMASEDVSYLMQDAPGMYFFVGASNAERGLTNGHHHPRFDFDEDALPLGVALMAAAVADYLTGDGK
jgi:amidohydrolase